MYKKAKRWYALMQTRTDLWAKGERHMLEVTFDVETITPLFLAGADQETAELRAPSFRGVMRYWYRALIGGSVGANLEDLKKAEASVFGTTDRGSAVRIRLSNFQGQTELISKEYTGKDYLLWSVIRSRRRYIAQNTKFRVTLAASDEARDELQKAISAFWLLSQLGGIGARSRRCAGNFSSLPVKGEFSNLPFHIPATAQELQQQLGTGLAMARQSLNIPSQTRQQRVSFDILAPQVCRIWILQNNNTPWSTADHALQDIGEKLQIYRRQIFPIDERKIFGIPVMVLNNQGKSRPLSINGAGSEAKRITSPLLLHISQLQEGQEKYYVVTATLFKTKWRDMSEKDYKLYQHIERWIQQDFSSSLEVQL